MKILYLISGTNMGGATLSFLSLLDSVIKEGITPYVVIPDDNKDFVALLEERKVKYFVVRLPFFCYPTVKKWNVPLFLGKMLGRIFLEWKAEKCVDKIVKEIKPDIIHTNVGPISVGHFVAKKNKLPHVWHIREYGDLDFNMHAFPSKKFFHKCLREDAVIAVSKGLLKYNEIENRELSFVVPNGVCKATSERNDVEKENIFLCASRVSPEKNIDEVIETFAKFCADRKDYQFLVLGSGEEKYVKSLQKLCAQLNVEEQVRFLGFSSKVLDFMKRAKALIVASKAEGFGRMTAEAGFAGCLVIGKNCGGTKEILQNMGGFPYESNSELLAAMRKVADMPDEEYRSFAANCQDKANQSYSLEAYTNRVISIYKKVVAKK